MHCYKIGEIPYGLNVDEAGMGYDSWCLANWGVDRYLNSYPVYLINFAGGQSALYAYVCMPFVYLWGINTVTVRIPAVIASFLTLFFLVLIAKRIWNNKAVCLILAMIYTVSPVFTMLFRIGLDCNLMLCVSTIFLYSLIVAIDNQKKVSFIVAGIAGGVVLYSYVLSHIVMPLFLIFVIIYLLLTNKINLSKIICMGIPIFIFALPLMVMHYINMYDLSEIYIGNLTIPKLYYYRNGDMSLSVIKDNVWLSLKNTLFYDGARYDSLEQFYNMYIVAIPFIGIGFCHLGYKLICSIMKRSYNKDVIFFVWFVCIYMMGLTVGFGGPNVYRLNAVYISYIIFLVDGLYFVWQLINIRWERLLPVYAVMVGTIYVISSISFALYYFNDYVSDTYLLEYFQYPYDEVFEYIDRNVPDEVSSRVTYFKTIEETYIYYLCSTMTPIYEYNTLEGDSPYEKWVWTQSYKNYRFYFPDEIDTTANYIIPDVCMEEVENLKKVGFEGYYVGHYYYMTNPWLQYSGENADAVISWDHGLDDDGMLITDDSDKTVLSGWAINSEYGKIWDDIIVEVDGVYYVADKMERQDVADIMGSDIFLNCGFHVTLDTQLVNTADNIRFICIDYEDESCYSQMICN
jgi:hypothetical protein